jgi:hypothetical protein
MGLSQLCRWDSTFVKQPGVFFASPVITYSSPPSLIRAHTLSNTKPLLCLLTLGPPDVRVPLGKRVSLKFLTLTSHYVYFYTSVKAQPVK